VFVIIDILTAVVLCKYRTTKVKHCSFQAIQNPEKHRNSTGMNHISTITGLGIQTDDIVNTCAHRLMSNKPMHESVS
jgi:hypothetical protein